MNGVLNLCKRVMIDMGTMPEYIYVKSEMDMSKETVRSMRRGASVSLRSVQKFADHAEIPGPVAFTDPLKDVPESIEAADLAFIPINITRHRKHKKMSVQDLASATGVMSSQKLEKIESSAILATTTDVQAIADVLEVNILELMMPPVKVAHLNSTPITHKSWLAYNAIIQVNRIRLKYDSFPLETDAATKITRGVDSARISAVEEIAEKTGVGIAELFLIPGLQTEWYRETKSAYFRENMTIELEEKGITAANLSRLSGVSEHTIGKIKSGKQLPVVKTAQRIADALDTEIGELFLPPKG